jgi:hypothetical protein
MATHHDCCDVISEDDTFPFSDGVKIGCLTDVAANPITILYGGVGG